MSWDSVQVNIYLFPSCSCAINNGNKKSVRFNFLWENSSSDFRINVDRKTFTVNIIKTAWSKWIAKLMSASRIATGNSLKARTVFLEQSRKLDKQNSIVWMRNSRFQRTKVHGEKSMKEKQPRGRVGGWRTCYYSTLRVALCHGPDVEAPV